MRGHRHLDEAALSAGHTPSGPSFIGEPSTFPGAALPRAADAAAPRRRGFSLVELVLVLAIALVLLGIAAPRLLGTSDRVALTNAVSLVSAEAAAARTAAMRYGRTSFLALDVVLDRVSVQVDTTLDGVAPPVTLASTDLRRALGVDLRASAPVICFDPRGMARPTMVCPGAAVVVRLARGGRVDSLSVSTTGVVWR